MSWKENIPLVRSLEVCTLSSKREASTEIAWTAGFSFLAIPVVLVIVLFTRPITDLPDQIFEVIGRGELMIYAAAVCGTTLYSLRHGMNDPIPDAIKDKVTALGTLSVISTIVLFFSLICYVVRRMGDIHRIYINYTLLNYASVGLLIFSFLICYIVLSLKFSLRSGSTVASHEQTEDFRKKWEAEKDA